MSDRLLKESDVLKIAFQLPLVVNSSFADAVKAIPSADNEVISKLKTAIENEEICKNCPTIERITGENLLAAMALGFSYGMEADRPQEWIPCSERNPEKEGEYLITLDFEWGREIEIGLWADGEWLNDNRHANIAWMPMIEPWKGADDES